MNYEQPGSFGTPVREGRDRLGRAHQMRVDIAIAIAMAPAWLRHALGDRDIVKARNARLELVERIAVAIERRFRVTWAGSQDTHTDARPIDAASPLFGGPDPEPALAEGRIYGPKDKEHKGNDLSGGVV